MSKCMARVAHMTLFVTLSLLATGCTKIATAIIEAGLDEMFDDFDVDARDPVSYYNPDMVSAGANSYVAFMTGTKSGNVYCLFTGSGNWDLALTYDAGETPIGITTTADGALAFTTNTGVSIPGLPIIPLDRLNTETGAAAIGVIAAGPEGAVDSVVVAATTADDESLLIRIDSDTGAILETTTPQPATKIEGLLVSGGTAITAESPGGAIVCYDLTEPQPEPVVLVEPEETVGQPAGMTVGASGNLVVASRDEPVIQEFDLDTGTLIRTIYIPEIASGGLRDIVFAPASDRYFVTAGGDTVYELDTNGEVVAVHVQGGLDGATSITLVEN